MRTVSVIGDQIDALNQFFRLGAFEQKRIHANRLVRQASATGFFPREMLVIKRYLEAGRGQALSTQSPGGTSANDTNPAWRHGFSCFRPSARVGINCHWGYRIRRHGSALDRLFRGRDRFVSHHLRSAGACSIRGEVYHRSWRPAAPCRQRSSSRAQAHMLIFGIYVMMPVSK
jgi:hypothetical protein